MISVGVYGATGYAGYELFTWLSRHKGVNTVFISSESHAGQNLSDIYPGMLDGYLVDPDEAPIDKIDVAFLALPNGKSGIVAKKLLQAGKRVIDISADFRFQSVNDYASWYGEHPAPEFLPAPYGLTEINRESIHNAELVGNPGCYPTSVLLALAPLLKAGMMNDLVIIDAKSGVTGAGRSPRQSTHFAEVSENLSPYNIGQVHRHVGEMQQEIGRLSSGYVPEIIFTPHLLPINRGILSTIYVRISEEVSEKQVREIFAENYNHEPFIRILPDGQLATIRHVAHTNMCVISLTLAKPGMLILVSCIDNLVKGAAGQAIQNMNVMFSLPETEGLLWKGVNV